MWYAVMGTCPFTCDCIEGMTSLRSLGRAYLGEPDTPQRQIKTGASTIRTLMGIGLPLHHSHWTCWEEAEEKGMLDERYDDPQTRHGGTDNEIIDSRELNLQDRRNALDSITTENETGDWSLDSVFTIIEVPDGSWRKVIIVDIERGLCTFRSTTTDTLYKPIIRDGMTYPWLMDNAMQDASTAMMREFLRVLREL